MSVKEDECHNKKNKFSRRKKKPNGFEQWGGYMAAKKMKLEAQFEEQKNIEQSQIFHGVAIFVNGYTDPPADELKQLMLLHSGTYHHYYSHSKTTHVIASNLPNSKMKSLKTQVVVTANWITDSIEAGKLLSHQKYLLYTPEVADKQHRLDFGNFFKKNSNIPESNENNCSEAEFSTETPLNAESDDAPDSTSEDYISENYPTSPSPQDVPPQEDLPPDKTIVSPQKTAAAMKAGHPDFLSEFYSHSRLHHISTAGQDLKRYVQQLVESNKDKHFPARTSLKLMSQQEDMAAEEDFSEPILAAETLKPKLGSLIMHLDMDCFFVSVGLRKHPELKGLPIAITHSKGKRGGPQEGSDIDYEANYYKNESQKKIGGLLPSKNPEEKPKVSMYSKEFGSLSEIASCSYEARKYGIYNGMLLGEALRRCPNLQTLPYDFEGYSEVSKQLYDIVASYTLDIEAVSCDELYIDCTELLQDVAISPSQFASALRAEIEKKTMCTASAGMGSNMLIARLANRVAKPNGQHQVCDSEVEEFMKTQKIGDLPGVGYRTSKKLETVKVLTCEDLQSWPLAKLQQEFGNKTGHALFNRCRGKDGRTVQCQKERKSVSAEINYGIRFETEEDVFNFINELAAEVQNRVQKINSKGRSVTLKVMVRRSDAPVQTAKFMGHGVCDHLSKSTALKCATDSAKVIAAECCSLVRSLKIKPEDFRGMGIQLSKLELLKDETKSSKPMKRYLLESKTEVPGIFSPKNLKEVSKPIPSKGTIKHFLCNTNNPSSGKATEIDQSVLDVPPRDMRKEGMEILLPVVAEQYHISSQNSSDERKRNQSNSQMKTSSAVVLHGENPTVEIPFGPQHCKKEDIPKKGSLKKPSANLGGAVDIDEIKDFIKEWIESAQEPLEEDVIHLKKFLADCIEEDMHKVNIVLKHLYRLAKVSSESWKDMYLRVLPRVQQKVIEVHATELTVDKHF